MQRFGVFLLLVGFLALGWMGWREAPAARSPLQVRFVGYGTNQWGMGSPGYSNLVFELHNSGIRPLYLHGHGRYSDWPLFEALSTHHLWSLDRTWFSTNRSPMIPSKGVLTLEIFAEPRHVRFPVGNSGPSFTNPVSTFVDTTRVWRFRFKSRGMGPFDLIPNVVQRLLPSEAIHEPRYQETILDVEMPTPPGGE